MVLFIFKAKGLAKEWDGKILFQNLDLDISAGEHIALFGRNGTGKTTLLNGLLGRLPFNKGAVQRFVSLEKWGVLDQHPQVSPEWSAINFVQSADSERYKLKQQLTLLEQQMQMRKDDDIWIKYSEVYERFLNMDGYRLETDAEKALTEAGLESSVWQIPFNQLSGGQKTKAQFARIMMGNPEFILLDEPTNHLDTQTLKWLENWLRNFPGAVLYVSHDRYFLDQTAQAIIELTEEGCKRYPGGYTAYREQKEVERRTQEILYKKQQQKKKALLETINRYQKWFHAAHEAAGQDDFWRSKAKKNVSRFHAKESELERLENEMVEKPEADRRADMRLHTHEFSAKTILRIEHLSFGYGSEKLFNDLNLQINRDDRIALIGPNGSGKSTLLKLIIGHLDPESGSVRTHPMLNIGYFAQELDNLEDDQNILDSLLMLPNMTQTEARTILGSFLFSKDDVFKKIRDLSMGEKCRIAFIKLYFSKANFLMLDEPTNFLDVSTREVVEQVLEAYPGAFLIVSHDRYFIKKLANRVIKLEVGEMKDYQGSYAEYLEFEKRGFVDSKMQEKENQIAQMELHLSRLLSTSSDDLSVEEQTAILTEARKLRRQIDQMKSNEKT